MKVKKCCKINCYNPQYNDTDYCIKHQHLVDEEREKLKIELRLGNLPKSELYKSYTWKKLRLEVLSETPYCTEIIGYDENMNPILCGSTEHLEVHHKIKHFNNPLIFFDKRNLQVLCRKHHQKKNMEQARGDTPQNR